MSDNNFSPDNAELGLQFQLEQRLMFDGAAVSTTADVIADGGDEPTFDESNIKETSATETNTNLFDSESTDEDVVLAVDEASTKIADFLNNASNEELFAIFGGENELMTDQWLATMEAIKQQILNNEIDVQITILDSETMLLAQAAFSSSGTDGNPVIYLNESLLASSDSANITKVLVEEFGHFIDFAVNGSQDTPGDEGQVFAAAVYDEDITNRSVLDENAALLVGGEIVEVERATYTFVNAYSVDTSGTPAGKETNTHDFFTTSLGSPTVDDSNTNVHEFSGNDISAAAININGTTYYGWISRPIKSGGVVRGFYFWTDPDFVDLATAQADGNTDGDGDVSDNLGFILVVDQAWFDAQSEISTGVKNVGSSSDRVDSALNALLTSNTAPSATADTDIAIEDGGVSNATSGSGATGNLLTNDTDADSGDTKVVTLAGTTGADTTVPETGSVDIAGQYGTLTVEADGSYSYVITSNSDADVEALRLSTNTVVDTFTYTVSDGDGATSTTTLSITIQGANDNPIGTDDYDTAKESLLADGNEYTSADPLGSTAIGNVLSNDSDVDENSESLSVGTLSGTVTLDSVTTAEGAVNLTFIGGSGFTAVTIGKSLYYNDGGTYRLLHASNGDVITVAATPTEDADTAGTYYVELSGTPAYYLDAGASQVAISSLDSTDVGFKSDTAETTATSSMKTATISTSEALGTSTVALTPANTTGLVAVGMSVSGSGVPDGTTVTSITYDSNGDAVSLEFDSIISTAANEVLTFTADTGSTVTGQYGDLVLNSDGSYVYTPFANNTDISEGESVVDSFNYTVTDLSGATHTATLHITVLGSDTNDPNAVSDTATAIEAGGVDNATSGTDPSGNVLTNDTTPAGSLTIDSSRSFSDSSATTVGTNTTITGDYGTLTISTDGSWSYAVDNSNSDVESLRSNTDTLTETFVYTVKNGQTGSGGDLQDADTLVITIQGANDAPVAANDTATAIEASGQSNGTAGFNPTGDVLNNDTDVDDAPSTLAVTAIRTGSVEGSGTAGTIGGTMTGTYGSLVLNSDGTWAYTVDDSNTDVNDLAPGETLVEYFNYTVTDGSGADLDDIAVLAITIEGASDAISVNDVYVNEASDYMIFTVSGAEGLTISLALSETEGVPSSDTVATLGTDTADSNTLEYFDGTNWVTYDSGTPPVMSATEELYVRIGVAQDTVHEGNETLSLVATTSDNSQAIGLGTINDEGEGDIFLSTNTTGTPNDSGDTDYPTLDDDRPTLAVTDTTVPEGDYAEFTVSIGNLSTQDISFTPTLVNGTATVGTDTAAGSTLEVSTNGGTNWSTVSGPVTILAGNSSVMLRIATSTDATSETSETFTLVTGNVSGTVTNSSGVTGTGTITDVANNSSPTPADNTYSTDEDVVLTSKNIITDVDSSDGIDTDPESDPLSVSEVDGTSWSSLTDSANTTYPSSSDWKEVTLTNGTIYLQSDGSMNYIPAANNHTGDSFTYKVNDGTVDSTTTATVTITVNSVDDAPVITGNTSGTDIEDTVVTGTLAVTDPDGMTDSSYFTVTTAAGNGTATIDPETGEWSYTPTADYNGSDSFTVTITDDAGNTTTQLITITVSAVADIAGDTDSTDEGTPVTTDVLNNDSFEGTPTITAVTQGDNGTVSIVNGQITYTPNADFNGTDSYTYTVTSGGVTETATVIITIGTVPDIADDTDSTEQDTPVTTDVLNNDSFEGTPTITAVTDGSNGTVTIVNGQTTYTPNPGFNGTDSYTYTVTSGGVTETATVTITVNSVDDAPVLTPPTTSNIVPPAAAAAQEPASPPQPALIVETTLAEPVQEDVLENSSVDLVVQRDIPEQNFTAVNGNTIVDFSIPADTFGFIGIIAPNSEITLNAIMLDGTKIPDWLVFEAETGRFHGIAPDGFEGTLSIRIIAVDGEGKKVDTIVTININADGSATGEGELDDKTALDETSSDKNNKGKLAFLDQLEKKNNPEKTVQKQMANAARLLKTFSKAS